MKLGLSLAAMLLAAAVPAYADCAAGIATAQRQAEALPASAGRAALMEQILRADNARHEGDEESCSEELSVAQQAIAETKH